MEDAGVAYTLAIQRVKVGKEEDFVQAWKGDLADSFLGLPKNPRAPAR